MAREPNGLFSEGFRVITFPVAMHGAVFMISETTGALSGLIPAHTLVILFPNQKSVTHNTTEFLPKRLVAHQFDKSIIGWEVIASHLVRPARFVLFNI